MFNLTGAWSGIFFLNVYWEGNCRGQNPIEDYKSLSKSYAFKNYCTHITLSMWLKKSWILSIFSYMFLRTSWGHLVSFRTFPQSGGRTRYWLTSPTMGPFIFPRLNWQRWERLKQTQTINFETQLYEGILLSNKTHTEMYNILLQRWQAFVPEIQSTSVPVALCS